MISAEKQMSPRHGKAETGRPTLGEAIGVMQKGYMHTQAEAICNKQEEIQVDDGQEVIGVDEVPKKGSGSGGVEQSLKPAPSSTVINIPHQVQYNKIREETKVDEGYTAIDIGEAIGEGHGDGNAGQDGATNETKRSEPTVPAETEKSFNPRNVNASDLMALLAIEKKPERSDTTVDVKGGGGGEKGTKGAKRSGGGERKRTRRERFMDAAGDVCWEIKYFFKHLPLWTFFFLAFFFMVLFLVGTGLLFFNVGDPSYGSNADVVETEQSPVDIVDGDRFTDGQAPLELESLEEAWSPGDHPPGQY